METFQLPDAPPPGHVLLETGYSLISPGTEKAGFLGLPNTQGGAPFPRYPGYSASGRILAAGEGVTDLGPGDRVIAYHSRHASHAVKERRHVVKIEDDALDATTAVFSLIASMGLQGIRKLRPELGESVGVMGLGLLGLFAVQFARLGGAFPLIALDFDPTRRDLALKLGADYAFSPDEDGLAETIRTLTRGGLNAVGEISGSPFAVKQALGFMAPMGRISLVGCSRTPTPEVDFYNDVHRPGVTLIGAHNFVRPSDNSFPGYWTLQDDLKMILRFFAAGRLQAAPLIADILAPQQAPEAYQRLAEGETNPPGILFDWRAIG